MKSVVFMGTPDFAVPALKALIASDKYSVKLVVSQPDRPQGRKQILTPSPVKEVALQNNIDVYQPSSLKTEEAVQTILRYSPDFIVVAAYGNILPKAILDIPRYGCVNLHGSLLPKYRGAAPIQWSIINGDEITGVTTMLMNEGLDTGDILLTAEKVIGDNETAGELFDSLSQMCPELLIKTLDALVDGKINPVKQNDSDASYVSVLDKRLAEIDWNKDARTIHNLIRGLNPWPVAKTSFNGKILKIFSSEVTAETSEKAVGSVKVKNNRLFVVCGDGILLRLDDLQLEGSKRMSSSDFLRGHSFEAGFIFK